ncbi:hypothetical protein V8Z74_24525 [Comamonas sp. w2-DMI]|uniref:hypothetical protein n=1 Tax=Comamonas sp. w2-DMI TaxID=3126391 RepID=UPI0032E49B5F
MKTKSILLAVAAVMTTTAWANGGSIPQPEQREILFRLGETTSRKQADVPTLTVEHAYFNGVIISRTEDGQCWIEAHHVINNADGVPEREITKRAGIACDGDTLNLKALRTAFPPLEQDKVLNHEQN